VFISEYENKNLSKIKYIIENKKLKEKIVKKNITKNKKLE
jgi:hypothetical protein